MQRNHGCIHIRAHTDSAYQRRAQHLLGALRRLRYHGLSNRACAHVLAGIPLPHHLHRLFTDSYTEIGRAHV